jgi:hypothetical protein
MPNRTHSDPDRERDLEMRRKNERADLDVERTIGPRPLEGFSHAPDSTWTDKTDDAAAAEEHGQDEARSRALSESQIPPK